MRKTDSSIIISVCVVAKLLNVYSSTYMHMTHTIISLCITIYGVTKFFNASLTSGVLISKSVY